MPCSTLDSPLIDERRSGRALSLGRLFASLGAMFQVARERRALMRLDAGAMKDLGLSRADVEREGTRAPWDLPADRLAK